MRNITLLAAALLSLTTMSGAIAIAQSPATQTQPAATEPQTSAGGEAQVPGDPQIARWDVILNDNGMDAIKQLEAPAVQTDSKIYQAIACDGAMLRGAVAQAAAAGGVENYSPLMRITSAPLVEQEALVRLGYSMNSKTHVAASGGGSGSLAYQDIGNGRMHLKIDFRSLDIHIFEADQQYSTTNPAAIVFEGDLGAGDALAFIGDFAGPSKTVYHHLMVWEIFKAKPWQVEYFANLSDSNWWCQNGPETLRGWANAALVWVAGAKHEPEQSPPDYQHKLDDGKIARLMGTTRSDNWPFCWWDGLGQPVDIRTQIYFGNASKKQWCLLQMEGAKGQTGAATPTRRPQPAGRISTGEPYTEQEIVNTNNSGEVNFGVAEGPWQQIGQVDLGGSIQIGSKTYHLTQQPSSGNDQFVVSLSNRRNTESGDMYTLTAVCQDGSELNPQYLEELTAKNYGLWPLTFEGQPIEKIKTFHVWQRKRTLVGLRHIPYQPPVVPKTDVTPEEVAAAEAVVLPRRAALLRQQAAKHELAGEERRKQWQAAPADPTSPMGALRAIINAAHQGDIQGVRHRLISSSGKPDQNLDLIAQYIVAAISGRDAVARRFGETDARRLTGFAFTSDHYLAMGVVDYEELLMDLPWQPRPDGGLQAAQMSVIKGGDGQYYLSAFDNEPDATRLSQHLQMLTRALEATGELLKENPTMTMDQIRAAMRQRPASRPSTQSSGS